jgi:hypothetical protein
MTPVSFEHILRSQLPIAWIAGVRLESYEHGVCKTCVNHDFLNQNPFGSMFWAVQGMAAEFAGGMMLLNKIEESGQSISSLVIKSESTFHKKATGKIVFTCNQGDTIDQEIQKAVASNSPSAFELKSVGTDETGDIVAEFTFTWSIKVRE